MLGLYQRANAMCSRGRGTYVLKKLVLLISALVVLSVVLATIKWAGAGFPRAGSPVLLQSSPDAAPSAAMRVIQRSAGEAQLPGYTRFVCLSDTHGIHRDSSLLKVPKGDVLVFAGDAGIASELQLPAFASWLADLPHKTKVLTFGNMDFWAASDKFSRDALPAADAILIGESAEAGGFRFTGSPFTPKFAGRFQLQSEEHAEQHWAAVLPPDTSVDILVTHGPPAGVADRSSGHHVGDAALARAVQALATPPALWVVGHIHSSYGVYHLRHAATGRDIVVANVATNDLRSGANTVPMVFDVAPAGAVA